MNQQECFNRLGFEREGDPDAEMSIGSMECAIVQSIDSRLVDSDEGMEEFKPCLFDSGYFLLEKGSELMFISIGGGDSSQLYVSGYASELFTALRNDHLLHKILDESIVTELERLSAQAAVDREAKAKERRRTQFEEMKLEFEGEAQ